MQLTEQEICTILHALRQRQWVKEGGIPNPCATPKANMEAACNHFDSCPELDNSAIDKLCQQLSDMRLLSAVMTPALCVYCGERPGAVIQESELLCAQCAGGAL